VNRFRVQVHLVILLSMIALAALPSLAAAQSDPVRAVVTLDAGWIKQGGLGFVHVSGEAITDVTGMFQERAFYFYPSKRGFTTLLTAAFDRDPGTYTLQLLVRYADGTTERLDQAVQVANGGYGSVELPVPNALLALTDPEVERAEMDKLFNIFNRFTPERYYGGGFVIPHPAELVAWFGTYRRYPGQENWTRHTGIDMKVGPGVPVAATASGRVILSEMLPIRGNYVLIDHGWGIYSGYAHLSERFVVPGEWVHKEDIIGLSGLTGRTTGAHIHFETAANGVWVDPEDLLALGLDTASE